MFPSNILPLKTIMLGMAVFGYSSAYADGSINCAKSRLPDEKAICRSVELQKQDVKMTTLFEVSGHLMAMGSRGAMQDRQYVWLKNRHLCKANTRCLKQIYRERIDELNQGLEQIYKSGPF
ncbi:MAG: lysozyme inhibitor LprI family protein [Aquirhabdus sp.]